MPDMIVKNKLLVESEVLDFLIRRKKYLDGVVITGGEPTIHADLSSFCQKLKDIGYDIKLDTNGLRPEVIKELIDGRLVDYIAMDIKGPADMIEKFAGQPVDTEKIKVTIELVKNSNLPYEFRSTVVSGFHRSEDIEKMAQMIGGAKKYWLQNFMGTKGMVGQDFKGASFTADQLKDYKKIVAQYVEDCSVR